MQNTINVNILCSEDNISTMKKTRTNDNSNDVENIYPRMSYGTKITLY